MERQPQDLLDVRPSASPALGQHGRAGSVDDLTDLEGQARTQLACLGQNQPQSVDVPPRISSAVSVQRKAGSEEGPDERAEARHGSAHVGVDCSTVLGSGSGALVSSTQVSLGVVSGHHAKGHLVTEAGRGQGDAVAASSVPDEVPGQVVLAGQQPSAGHRRGRLLAAVVLATILLVLVVAQRSVLAESVRTLHSLQWVWVPVALLADFASRATVASTHRRLLRAGGARISQHAALQVEYAANALSVTLPVAGAQVGTAFTFKRFRGAGVSAATTAWTLLISGIAATSSFALLLAVGAVATGTAGGLVLGVGGALLAALPGWAVLAALRSPAGRRRLQALLVHAIAGWRRVTRSSGPPPQAALRAVLDQLTVLRLPTRDRTPVVLLAVANWLLDCLCLAAAILAVGAAVPWQGLLLASLAASGATTLALTPGGLGTVELALTAALVAAGLDAPSALAATLVYRIVSLWVPAIGGWLTYALLRSRAARDAETTAGRR